MPHPTCYVLAQPGEPTTFRSNGPKARLAAIKNKIEFAFVFELAFELVFVFVFEFELMLELEFEL